MKVDNHKFFKIDVSEVITSDNSEFNNVTFDNCEIGLSNDIDNLPHFKNVKFNNCSFVFCTFGPAIFEKVEFNNIKFEDYGIFWSPLFNKIKLKGKFTSFRLNSNGFMLDNKPKIQDKLDNIRAKFYEKVDWALDISEAKFSSFDYNGIPGKLFIRDSDTQFLITKKDFNSLELLDNSFKDNFSYLMMYLEDFIESNAEDIVIPVPLAKPKKFREPILEGLRELRRLGFAKKD